MCHFYSVVMNYLCVCVYSCLGCWEGACLHLPPFGILSGCVASFDGEGEEARRAPGVNLCS